MVNFTKVDFRIPEECWWRQFCRGWPVVRSEFQLCDSAHTFEMTPYIYIRETRVYHQATEGVAEIRGVAGRAVNEVGEGILTSCSRVQVARVGPRQKLGVSFVTRDDLRGRWSRGLTTGRDVPFSA